MLPQTPVMSWEQFCKTVPPFSIALDGFVGEGPKFDPKGPRVNLNHHEGVDRLGTRATCAQTLMAIRQGLLDCFRDHGKLHIEVFVNDCDEDVCTSWTLLHHAHLAVGAMNPALNRIVAMEDMLDTTAGGYPYPPDLPALQEMAWIFDPYRRFRMSGGLGRKRSDEYEGVVTDVENRILRYLVGQGEKIPLDTRYDRIGGGKGWAMIREIGPQGRTGVFGDGIRAYVSLVQVLPNGRYIYTVGRMSLFIAHFQVPAILAALDREEGSPHEHWGGGDTIGGSPRVNGSRLAPEEVERIVNETLAHE
jgi:hypothetical protein